MNAAEYAAQRKWVSTPHGEIAYVERGSGPAALFVHGILLNGYLWRSAIESLSDGRRCIALDLLGHGATKTAADVDVSFPAQAAMIESFLDALGIEQVDLVANDSGGGISQIVAAEHPERIRSLVLTNCDTHDNYPPPALDGLVNVAKAGGLGPIGKQWMENPEALRHSFGTAYEHPERVMTAENIEMYLGPLFESAEATRKLERMVATMDNSANVRIEPKLRQVQAPALIIWGTDDVFFDVKWAHWLKERLPGAREVIEVAGAKLFFPEERPEFFCEQVRKFWATVPVGAAA